MSINKKRLHLHRETLRNLNVEELDYIRGGVLPPPTDLLCFPDPPVPWPHPDRDPPDGNPTPPDGFPPIKLPPKKYVAVRQQSRRTHSANGYCTGI